MTEQMMDMARRSAQDLTGAYAICREITRRHARSFYFCTQFLPAAKRQPIYAVYGLCRSIDDIVDRAPDRSESAIRCVLESWRRRVRVADSHDDPVLLAWHDTAERFDIDTELAEELMRGVLMDLTEKRYGTYDELAVYCYRVASVVGLMTSRIFGYSDARALDHAIELGRAMQLTNILRDVGEDARMGRIYLPLDELSRFGVRESEILEARITPEFVRLMKFQIERARALYRAADPGIRMLSSDCRYAVALSSRIYSQILGQIERNRYDVLTRRAYVPFHRKVTTVPSVWLSLRA